MRLVLFLFVFLLQQITFAQLPENAKKQTTIKHKADNFTTDRLGNVYLYNQNFIWLYNTKGESIAAFNSRKYGDITSVDATDPYKILVFFADYNLLLFLDNYLSLNGESIELEKFGFDQISMACKSRDDGFWIFDLIKQKAIHLNENFKADRQSVNLFQWFGKRIDPNFMLEYNNQLFINEPTYGIYQFDHFGTYQKKIAITELHSFQKMSDNLHYFSENRFCQYSTMSLLNNCKELPIDLLKNVRIEKDKFYLLTEKELQIFSTN